MRKWGIAGLALVAIGVSWYVLSQPRKRTDVIRKADLPETK